jgi:purine-nucleoside phosphorylase
MTSATRLDVTVHKLKAQLAERRFQPPDVLFLMGTGVDLFGERLRNGTEFELGELEEMPHPWRASELIAGKLGQLSVWLLDDIGGEPDGLDVNSPWLGGLPIWLAAAAGASVMVHTSAGSALRSPETGKPLAPVGGFGFVRDHINLSGRNPLIGLSQSSLGPLFPDLSELHHLGLRRSALMQAEKLGLPSVEVVCACTPGPAIETPAERALFARAGAEVSVQSLATPLLCAAHAGLATLSIVALTDAAGGPTELQGLVASASTIQPALQDLLTAMTEDLASAVDALTAGENV